MIKLTLSDVHVASFGVNSSGQACIFDTDGTTVITNLQKPTQVSAVVAQADADDTLAAAEVCDSKIFTITASTARALTLPIATDIVAAITGYAVGMEWDITIINLGAGVVTMTQATGSTIVGVATVAATSSATFRVFIASATAVVLYRK